MDTERRIIRRPHRPPVLVPGARVRRRRNFFILLLLLVFVLLWLVTHRPAPKAAAHKTLPVTVATVQRGNMPVLLRSFGNVTPVNSVAVKSRVSGNLVQIHFKEGQNVSAGQALFTIDPRPLQAALEEAQADVSKQHALILQAQAQIDKDNAGVMQARANLTKDIAVLRNANVESRRYMDLVKQGAVSMEQYQQYQTNELSQRATVAADQAAIRNAVAVTAQDRANLQSARAQLKSSIASLENAKVQLSYASITSPISGKTGNIQVLLGNDVTADQQVLLTVNQLAPIYVQFAIPQNMFQTVRGYASAGSLITAVRAPNGQSIASDGTVTFMDNQVDTTTGTVKIKAIFSNAQGKLWPGQYVDVVLTLTVMPNVPVVPAEAVQTGPNGTFVWVVRPDSTVVMQPVAAGPSNKGLTAIESGLKPGQIVVTDGQLSLTPGAYVSGSHKPGF